MSDTLVAIQPEPQNEYVLILSTPRLKVYKRDDTVKIERTTFDGDITTIYLAIPVLEAILQAVKTDPENDLFSVQPNPHEERDD